MYQKASHSYHRLELLKSKSLRPEGKGCSYISAKQQVHFNMLLTLRNPYTLSELKAFHSVTNSTTLLV